jgi:hypothetical protein
MEIRLISVEVVVVVYYRVDNDRVDENDDDDYELIVGLINHFNVNSMHKNYHFRVKFGFLTIN